MFRCLGIVVELESGVREYHCLVTCTVVLMRCVYFQLTLGSVVCSRCRASAR